MYSILFHLSMQKSLRKIRKSHKIWFHSIYILVKWSFFNVFWSKNEMQNLPSKSIFEQKNFFSKKRPLGNHGRTNPPILFFTFIFKMTILWFFWTQILPKFWSKKRLEPLISMIFFFENTKYWPKKKGLTVQLGLRYVC